MFFMRPLVLAFMLAATVGGMLAQKGFYGRFPLVEASRAVRSYGTGVRREAGIRYHR